jgi:predicted 2-oxoglutarate/Fe(II)-dependent dioxygenase YbiX
MTMLIEIPDVLTPDELRQCRDLLQQASWHDGRQTAGHIAARAKDNQQLAQGSAGRAAQFVPSWPSRQRQPLAAAALP